MTKHLMMTMFAAIAFVGCGKSKPAGVPCDAKAVGALAAQLDKASGFNVDLTDPKVKDAIAAAAKDVTGKTFAFKGCKFRSQGNDIVSFTAADSEDAKLDCAMKGGEQGVTEFRHAAMKVGQAKLLLDVTGVIASHGDGHFARLTMTDCEIAAHD